MLNKIKKGWKEFLVLILMVAIIIYAVVGFWLFSAILLSAMIGISTQSASAVIFIVFVLAELFAAWRSEAGE